MYDCYRMYNSSDFSFVSNKKIAIDFVGSTWSFVFFHPCHNGRWPPTSIQDFIHYYFVLSLFLSISLLMLTAKQGTYWYHLYNVFGIARSLTMYWTRDLPHWMSSLYTRLSRRIVIFVRNEIVFVFKPESYMQSFYSTE